MSRSYQHIGLTEEAENFMEKHCVTTNAKITVDLFYGDGPCLHQYKSKNGNTIKEVVQEAPWSSGPMGFLCLEDENGIRFCEWSEEDIDSMV